MRLSTILNETAVWLNENKLFDKNSIKNERETKHWSVPELMSSNKPTNECNHCNKNSNSREIFEHQPNQPELHLKLKHLDFDLKVCFSLSNPTSVWVLLVDHHRQEWSADDEKWCIYITAQSIMRVFARQPGQSGTTLELHANVATDTVGHLKASIAAMQRVAHDRVRIVFSGQSLDQDWQLLSEIGINNESSVSFLISGGGTMMRMITTSRVKLIGLDWIGLDWMRSRWRQC